MNILSLYISFTDFLSMGGMFIQEDRKVVCVCVCMIAHTQDR